MTNSAHDSLAHCAQLIEEVVAYVTPKATLIVYPQLTISAQKRTQKQSTHEADMALSVD